MVYMLTTRTRRPRRVLFHSFLWSFLLITLSISMGCASRKDRVEELPEIKYAKGIALFEKKKWVKASEEFNWVVINNPAGALAADAQYYYAECLFQQKQYVEAEIEFERLNRRWVTTKYQEKSRYRITQCLVEQSPPYPLDQKLSFDAIEELQAFIEEFPGSKYEQEALRNIAELRTKLARKLYEGGRLYLKHGEYESAQLYFDQVLGQYYDTIYADQARIGILLLHILRKEVPLAEEFFQNNKTRFTSDELRKEAKKLLEMGRDDDFDLSFYIRLYR